MSELCQSLLWCHIITMSDCIGWSFFWITSLPHVEWFIFVIKNNDSINLNLSILFIDHGAKLFAQAWCEKKRTHTHTSKWWWANNIIRKQTWNEDTTKYIYQMWYTMHSIWVFFHRQNLLQERKRQKLKERERKNKLFWLIFYSININIQKKYCCMQFSRNWNALANCRCQIQRRQSATQNVFGFREKKMLHGFCQFDFSHDISKMRESGSGERVWLFWYSIHRPNSIVEITSIRADKRRKNLPTWAKELKWIIAKWDREIEIESGGKNNIDCVVVDVDVDVDLDVLHDGNNDSFSTSDNK